MDGSALERAWRTPDLIWALTWRQFTPRNRRDKLRLIWVFVEPIGQIALMMAIFSLIGRAPAYGDSFALFLLTGVAVLNTFTSTAQLVAGAIYGLNRTSRLAPVGLFHEALARTLFTLIVVAIYMPILMWGLSVVQHADVGPHHLAMALAALLLTGLMGFGVGLLRGYAMLFVPVIERVYVILSRGLIFVSGVFFAPSLMPPQLRDLLIWNPLLHAVEMLRLGIYAEYPTIVFSDLFLVGFMLGATSLGVALIWRKRATILG